MKSPEAKAALLEYLELLPDDKRREIVAVTPQVLGVTHLYHLSRDNDIRQFSPSVSKRTAGGEDRSIPRISTAVDWAGCIMGYQSDINDFLRREATQSAHGEPVPFRGGWIVYGLPFEYALRPSNALVPDAVRSGEHWLVTYAEYNIDYTPVKLAKVFYESFEQRALPHNHITSKTTVIIEVLEGQTFRLGAGYSLNPGYYRVVVKDLHMSRNHRQVDFLEIKEITSAEYLTLKGATAGLLSFDNPVPASMSW